VASSPTELTETDAGVITLDIGSADAGTQGTLALAHDDARRIDHLARALKLERGKDLAGALVEARRAHYDRPGREALEATARVAGKLHDRATEGVALRELANLSPKDAGPLTRLARLHADSSDLAQAAQVAGEAAERDPTSVEAWHLKGLAELRRGALPQAIAAFETTVRLNPRHSWALNNLGYALLLSGNPEKAVVALERAQVLASHLACVHNNLGVAYEQLGRLDEAQLAYSKALELEPEHPRAAANFARTAEALGWAGPTADGEGEGEGEGDAGVTGASEWSAQEFDGTGSARSWPLEGAKSPGDDPSGVDLREDRHGGSAIADQEETD
jgi:Flp pilus assembly protein TadD